MLIKFLVLLDMGLLDLLLSLLMLEYHRLELDVELLLLQLSHSVLCHLSLDIFSVLFALDPVLFHGIDKVLDVLLIDLSILSAVLVWTLLSHLLLLVDHRVLSLCCRVCLILSCLH